MPGSPWIVAKSLKHMPLEDLISEIRQGIARILDGMSQAEAVRLELKARGLPGLQPLLTPGIAASLKDADAAFLKLALAMRSQG